MLCQPKSQNVDDLYSNSSLLLEYKPIVINSLYIFSLLYMESCIYFREFIIFAKEVVFSPVCPLAGWINYHYFIYIYIYFFCWIKEPITFVNIVRCFHFYTRNIKKFNGCKCFPEDHLLHFGH